MWVQEVRVLDKVRHFEAGDWLEATQGEIGLVTAHGLHRLDLILCQLNSAIAVLDKAVHVGRQEWSSSVGMKETTGGLHLLISVGSHTLL